MIDSNTIFNLVPQKPPFVMLDKLIGCEKGKYTSEFRVDAKNIFIEGQKLLNYALIENIGQTAAVGLKLTSTTVGKFQDGVLGGIYKLQCYGNAKIDDVIKTEVQLMAEMGSLFKVKGSCFVENLMIFECELNISAID